MKIAFIFIAAVCLSTVHAHRLAKRQTVTTKTTTKQGQSPTFTVDDTKVTQIIVAKVGLLDSIAAKKDLAELATSGGGSVDPSLSRSADTDFFNKIASVFKTKATTLQKAYDDKDIGDCSSLVNDLVTLLGPPPKASPITPLYDPLAKIAADTKAAIDAAGGSFPAAQDQIKKLIDGLNLAGRPTNELRPIIQGWLNGVNSGSDVGGVVNQIRREAYQMISNPVTGSFDPILSKANYIAQQIAAGKDYQPDVNIPALKEGIIKYLYAVSDLTPEWRTLIQAWNPIETEREGNGSPNVISGLLTEPLQSTMNRLSSTVPDLTKRIGEIQPFWDRANSANNGDKDKPIISVPTPTNEALIELGKKILGILPDFLKPELLLDASRNPKSKAPNTLLPDVGKINEDAIADDPKLVQADLNQIQKDVDQLAGDPRYKDRLPALVDDIKRLNYSLNDDLGKSPSQGISDATGVGLKQLTIDAFLLGLPNANGGTGKDPIAVWLNRWLELILKIIRDVKALDRTVQEGGARVKQLVVAPKLEFETDVAQIIYAEPWVYRFSTNILTPFKNVFGGFIYQNGYTSRKLTQSFIDQVSDLRTRVIGEALLAVKDLRAEEARRRGALISGNLAAGSQDGKATGAFAAVPVSGKGSGK